MKRWMSVVGSSLIIGLGGAVSHADPVCGARVSVREVGMQPNDDGTRTLKYRATVQTDFAGGSCAKVSFSVVRSFVKRDGTSSEGAIPQVIETKRRTTEVDGVEVLPTTRLVYWSADDVRCEPCAGEGASAASRGKAAAEVKAADEGKERPKGRKKAAAVVGAVALGALLLL